MRKLAPIALFMAALAVVPVSSQSIPNDTFAGLRARLIGPAVTSGRVMTIAVNPTNSAEFFLRLCYGSLDHLVAVDCALSHIFDINQELW